VEWGRGVVCPRARGDAGRAEPVHLLPVLRRFTRRGCMTPAAPLPVEFAACF
jgi:hypothetical protein